MAKQIRKAPNFISKLTLLHLAPTYRSFSLLQFDKECRTKKPVSADTTLRFEVLDSDKPSDPDWIGMSKVKVSDLILNRKLDSKESFPIEGRQFPKYYIKAKIDFKPEK